MLNPPVPSFPKLNFRKEYSMLNHSKGKVENGKEYTNMMEPAKDYLDLGILVRDIKASLTFYVDILGTEICGKITGLVWDDVPAPFRQQRF